jgi:hypothetical protein
MALMNVQFHEGVYFAAGESTLTHQDAEHWNTTLRACIAAAHGTPVVALFDLSRTKRMMSSAYLLIADATRLAGVHSVVCVVSNVPMSLAVRSIAALSERGTIHMVEDAHEGRMYASVTAANARAAYA